MSQANRCTLLIVSMLDACNICVDRMYELWTLISTKLSDKTCKILVVSKLDLKNQSGTDKAGGYDLNSVPATNVSTCANACVHVHQIVIKEEGQSKLSMLLNRLRSFCSELCSCISGNSGKFSRHVFKSSNLWTVSAEYR